MTIDDNKPGSTGLQLTDSFYNAVLARGPAPRITLTPMGPSSIPGFGGPGSRT